MKDILDHQRQNFSMVSSNQKNARNAMQNLYKIQLDEVMNEKNKQKQKEKEEVLQYKSQFTSKAIQNQQQQKMKEKAYKNYYEMLSKNQQDHQKQFISPFSKRDSLKDNHIKYSIEEGQMKIQKFELQERQRQASVKNRYKEELLNQIQQRRKRENEQKQIRRKSKEQFQMFGKLPSELSKYERQRHKQQMKKYKEDLDHIKQTNEQYSRSRSQRNVFKVPEGQHHLLINPLPYNIQNPYILKQMHRQTYQNNQHIHEFNRPIK